MTQRPSPDQPDGHTRPSLTRDRTGTLDRRAPLVVVGDALLDHDVTGSAHRLAPDAPVPVVEPTAETARPGGAALAAWLAAGDGREVTLVTALGDDPASHTLRELLDGYVRIEALPLSGGLSEKTRVLAGGHPLLRLDRGTGRASAATSAAEEAIRTAGALLVADYGRGTADVLRPVLSAVAAHTPTVWDPHPRGGAPVPGTRLATPARAEAREFAAALRSSGDGAGHTSACAPPDHHAAQTEEDPLDAARWAAALVEGWRVGSVAVTLGAQGALLSQGGLPLLIPAASCHPGDTCGAGDRFASAAAGLLADGKLAEEAARRAVEAAGSFVGAGGAAALGFPGPANPGTGRRTGVSEPPPPPVRTGPRAGRRTPTGPGAAHQLARATREEGGTLVATGGCFDLLHAGHVSLLEAAARIGDRLIVCVNSDASVRRRKSQGRPISPLTDRVRVLSALACVDAVAVFDEDTPEQLLAQLRPHVWAKGGDYAHEELPEARLLRDWGGRVVLLPYLDGRSSTGLALRAAASHGALG
ncbi:PfkB family carbohydrate kinase [Streptomyces iconiensis]|uniref:PfkB family carbohydrate kinase n=1 Tax=Streptomyces iconiensis TaxID=1384038 RepID=A0ABT6ZUU5_9ACTN|nr:PfkB family carbohydrate kinase [Streptomyces iconiensis]MDJ1132831.1 PfkB family carbohydrate kinase [Streptomyces iconiensis]